jgi:hypothetical protein
MTDQQRATICSRCGGLRDRCECAEIRREAFAEAAACIREYSDDLREMCVAGEWAVPIHNALCTARARVSALARKPGPVT